MRASFQPKSERVRSLKIPSGLRGTDDTSERLRATDALADMQLMAVLLESPLGRCTKVEQAVSSRRRGCLESESQIAREAETEHNALNWDSSARVSAFVHASNQAVYTTNTPVKSRLGWGGYDELDVDIQVLLGLAHYLAPEHV
jgi:hypothetical protein